MILILYFCIISTSVLAKFDSFEHQNYEGSKTTNCSCGRTNKYKGRIVNGVEAGINEFPMMAGIRTQDDSFVFCGGTIITKYHVLTAAHCPEARPEEKLAVVIGVHNVANKVPPKHIINVNKIINHHKYNINEHIENDISLFVLEKSIKFGRNIEPACFPSIKNVNLVGETVKIMGWGQLFTDGPHPSSLRKVNLKIVPLKKCSDYYGSDSIIKSTQICTYRANKDSCQGDSGGPLVWLDPATNRFTLVGIVSYGDQCAQANVPGVNTAVQYYRNWILSKISETMPAETCQK